MKLLHQVSTRKPHLPILAGCGFLLIFLCACSLFSGSVTEQENKPGENEAAPDFTLSSAQGDQVALHDFLGQPVLVNFWATWCGPCRAEMPGMEAIHQKHKAEGLIILAVNTGDSQDDVNDYAQDLGLSFRILMDVNNAISDHYLVNAIPQSFFIDKQGIIRRVVIGSLSEEELETYVQEILTSETSATATRSPEVSLLKGCVNTSVLNVRNGPGLDYKVIRGLSKDECQFFDAASADQKWLRLANLKSPKEERLWVSAEFIDLAGEINRLSIQE